MRENEECILKQTQTYLKIVVFFFQAVFKLTIATGSLLRVAARLNVFTCVLLSKAFANSFSVGIGIFYIKKINPVIRKASHISRH